MERGTVSEDNAVLDTQGAATFLGVHVKTVRRLAKCGEIPSYKVGRKWCFRAEALKVWTETHHVRQQRPLVLVADDEKGIRDPVALFLKADNYRVVTAASGAEAIASVQQEMPDIVLLDLAMPDMNGVEVLKALHRMDPDLPVVIVTAFPDSEMMSQAMQFPPVMLLPKPVKKADIIRTVHRVLSGSGHRRTVGP
jgi:excisionase family DNA binding protein